MPKREKPPAVRLPHSRANNNLSRARITRARLEIIEGKQQSEQLRELGDAEIVLGKRTPAHVKAHLGDADAPESLFLVLRMIRYGCNHASWTDSTEQKGARKANRRDSPICGALISTEICREPVDAEESAACRLKVL